MTSTTQATTTSSNTGFERRNLPYGLLNAKCYHGFIIKRDVELNVRRIGDYAVWAQDADDSFVFYVAVRANSRLVKHYRLISTLRAGKIMWSIEGLIEPANQWFVNINELLKSLQKSQGICTIKEPDLTRLKRPAKRPVELIRDSKIHLEKTVGEGSFCTVSSAKLRMNNGALRPVAVKGFKETGSYEQICKEQKEFMMEVQTMSMLSHPNIVHFYGVLCDHSPIKIVMEYCPGGSLLSHLKEEGNSVSVGERLFGGRKPWAEENVKSIVQEIKTGHMPKFPSFTPSEIITLAGHCWQHNPEQRPSFGYLAELSSQLVQDHRFALPPITKRTLMHRQGIEPRSSDNFDVQLKLKSTRPRQLFSGHENSIDDTTEEPQTRTKHRSPRSHGRSRIGTKKSLAEYPRLRKSIAAGKKMMSHGRSKKTGTD
ncbi:Tyrosine-protein kinase [Aphelenchoides besseyi]|nr:Tyrosine-protein kinase [Aphelenchoides besseyi]